ncbi:glucose-6-phosphate isomerase [Natrarchaeobaculum sulfurireducens]|uniref:Probable glucose-6-phosphate isomerase n=1 Tax=Natrarchaeobaculum sulfurireducens TaxID=2044521 RepID=A0A346PIB0_9EURY|nr:glucose-6-phosphate isomerase [Natrarchaeobaculum sulfurireducens]AXR79255.1 Glucose-6-phosphate isomerase [Natrarchaeobaculum sulfurireducens]
MNVDIGNALSSVASPGISRAGLERIDEQVAVAHERIERGMADGEHGYEALNLPEKTDPDEIRTAVEPVADCETLVTVGIGGSALGAATIVDALEAQGDGTETVFLDNVDPAWVSRRLEGLTLSETAINVVSRSGMTAETLANFLVVREAFDSAGVDWTERTIVTTGESGPLRELADRHDLPSLAVPDGVPGRYAALSAVGLVAAAVCDLDIEAILEGADAERKSLTGSLFECPAYAYGATAYALDGRGAGINAMMPYAESLETFAEWFAQLWAESLGKDDLGQTPVRALGATDQHSQLQLYRAGPRDKLVTFVTPQARADRSIPDTDVEDLAYLGDATLGELLEAEFSATEASLAAAGQPNVRIELERVDAAELGGLLYGMEAACVLAGELYGVNTFEQPAVEWAKNATRGLLGGGEFEEAEAVAAKTELRVER